MTRLRVIVADDHPVVRLGICNALQKESDIDVVAEAADGAQALTLTGELRPDVLILDAQMPEMDGLEATRAVRAQYPDVRILILSAYAHDHYVFGTLAEGADGYLLKDEAVDHVVSAVRVVAAHETWLSPEVATKVVQRTTARDTDGELGPDQPTEREMDVLELLAQGLSNEEIAQALYITERTVRFHISNLKAKLHASSRIELVVEAIRLGLVEVT
jgi:DNA-binding NarL/FixJ family response regulator